MLSVLDLSRGAELMLADEVRACDGSCAGTLRGEWGGVVGCTQWIMQPQFCTNGKARVWFGHLCGMLDSGNTGLHVAPLVRGVRAL